MTMREVVDLEAAIAAAAKALRTTYPALNRERVPDVARTAVEAAAEVLGLVDRRSVEFDPPAITTDTVTPREDYL